MLIFYFIEELLNGWIMSTRTGQQLRDDEWKPYIYEYALTILANKNNDHFSFH